VGAAAAAPALLLRQYTPLSNTSPQATSHTIHHQALQALLHRQYTPLSNMSPQATFHTLHHLALQVLPVALPMEKGWH